MNALAQIVAGDGDDAFRSSVVGASEVAALFGCHPWLTEFELWQRKAGKLTQGEFNAIGPDGVPENERAYWGVRFEREIIEAAKERWSYADREQVKNLHNGKGLGGHPDRRVTCPSRGPGILETKMVDWLEWKKWDGEPPLNYLLQTQTYVGLDACLWGDMIVLVGGNKLERYQYDFRPIIYADIEARVSTFWSSIAENKPPKPDYTRDKGALAQVYAQTSGGAVDLRHDNRMLHLAAEYLDATEHKRAAEKRVEALQAEILDKVGENEFAMVEGFSVKVPTIAGQPDKEVTADMVGTVIKGKRPHRRFYIKEIAA